MEGGCDCKRVRYRLATKPIITHCCHCRWCQRETGSAFVLNAMIETDRLRLVAGQTVGVDTPSESGAGQRIHRCPDCQIALWSHYAGAGEKIAFLRVGTLDNPDACPPDIHIYTASKQPWVILPADRPIFEGWYDREKVWPAEALARRVAALAKP